MALIDCRECKHQVSSEAITCPRCGAGSPGKVDRPKKDEPKIGPATGWLTVVILVLGLMAISKIY